MIEISLKDTNTLKEKYWKDAKTARTGLLKSLKDADNKTFLKTNYRKLYDYLYNPMFDFEDRVKKLVLADYDEMISLIHILGRINLASNEKRMKQIFNYDNLSTRIIMDEYTSRLSGKTCPYCNRQYVVYSKIQGKKWRKKVEIDHFFPRSVYIYLSVSLWNLIPTCHICNGLKSDRDTKNHLLLYPFKEGFRNEAVFYTEKNSSATWWDYWLGLTEAYKVDIVNHASDPKRHKAIDDAIKLFCLKETYSEHKDYINAIRRKEALVSEDFIRDLVTKYPFLFSDRKSVLNMIFMSELDDDKMAMRPLSKLTRDILRQDKYY